MMSAHGEGFGVTHGEVSGFRSARHVAFSPGPTCALVSEARAGKSNVIAAIRAVLDRIAELAMSLVRPTADHGK